MPGQDELSKHARGFQEFIVKLCDSPDVSSLLSWSLKVATPLGAPLPDVDASNNDTACKERLSDTDTSVIESVNTLLGHMSLQLETLLHLLEEGAAADADAAKATNSSTNSSSCSDKSSSNNSKLKSLGMGKQPAQAPQTMLSINDIRAVYTAMELVWLWGIQPALPRLMSEHQPFDDAEGPILPASAPVPTQHTFKEADVRHPRSLFISAPLLSQVMQRVSSLSAAERIFTSSYCGGGGEATGADAGGGNQPASAGLSELIMYRVRLLCVLAHNECFSHLVLQRFLSRITHSLLVLAGPTMLQRLQGDAAGTTTATSTTGNINNNAAHIVPQSTNGSKLSVTERAFRLLESLMLARDGIGTYRNMVVSSLRVASQGPKWIQHGAARLSKTILLSPHGLEAVIQGYLDGYVESPHLTAIQQKLAVLLTSAPEGAPAEPYLKKLCVQVVRLFILGTRNQDTVLVKLLVLVTFRVCSTAPKVAMSELLIPLAQPFLCILNKNKSPEHGTAGPQREDAYDVAIDGFSSEENDINATVNQADIHCCDEKLLLAMQCAYALLSLAPATARVYDCMHRCGIGRCLAKLSLSSFTIAAARMSEVTIVVRSFMCAYMTNANPTQVAQDLLWAATASKKGYSIEASANGGLEIRYAASASANILSGQSGNALSVLLETATAAGADNSALGFDALLSSLKGDDSSSAANTETGDESAILEALLQLAALKAQGGTDKKDIFNDAIDEQDGIAEVMRERAGEMLHMGASGKALAELLVYAGEARTHDMDASKSQESSAKKSSQHENSPVAATASALFLHCLSSFLGVFAATSVVSKGNGSDSKSDKSKSALEVQKPAQFALLANANKAQCGMLLMYLQAHVPTSVLLDEGAQVLTLLDTFLRASAASYDSVATAAESNNFAEKASISETAALRAENIAQSALERARAATQSKFRDNQPISRKGPLIQEILPGASSAPSISATAAPASARRQQREEEEEGKEDATNALSEEQEALSAVLGLLAMLVSAGETKRAPQEEQLIRGLLPSLQIVAQHEENADISQAAAELALEVLTRGLARGGRVPAVSSAIPASSAQHTSEPLHTSTSTLSILATQFAQAEELLQSDAPSERALGVRSIIHAVRGTAKISNTEVEVICCRLISLMADSESFVYLNAFHAVTALANHSRASVFSLLLTAFMGPEAAENVEYPLTEAAAALVLPFKHRAVIAESLSLVLRRAGEAAPPLVPSLVAACVKLVRKLRPTAADKNLLESTSDLRKMRLRAPVKEVGVEVDGMEVKEGVESQTESPELNIPELPETTAQVADRVLLHQSALSLLADAIECAGWAAHAHLADVLDIASGVLLMERGRGQVAGLTRRSAAFMLRYIVSGLKEKLFLLGETSHVGYGKATSLQQDSGSYLLSMYRTLKLHKEDPDSVVRFHVLSALESISDMVKKDFASNMGVNEKVPQISILKNL